jgi:hypothetical protein
MQAQSLASTRNGGYSGGKMMRSYPMAEGGIKHDGEKPRVDLLPSAPLVMIADVLGFGARKYAPHNWRKGFDQSRLIGAALRHLLAYNDGEDIDPESGLSHVAHAGCCILFLLEQINKGTGRDDRFRSNGDDI